MSFEDETAESQKPTDKNLQAVIKRIVKGIETDESLQLGNGSDGESD